MLRAFEAKLRQKLGCCGTCVCDLPSAHLGVFPELPFALLLGGRDSNGNVAFHFFATQGPTVTSQKLRGHRASGRNA